VNPAYLTAALASVFFGGGDFCGGLGARRAPVGVITFVAWVAGIVVLLAGVPLVGGVTRAADLGWGALAGVSGALGAALLYRALAIGPASVASPIFCIVGLALPLLVGLVIGERPQVFGVVGLILAPASIVLLTRETGTDAARGIPSARRVLGPSLLAGSVIGFFLVFMARIQAGASLWPLVMARSCGMVGVGVWLAVRREPFVPPRGARLIACAAGALDAIANVLYVASVQHGLLSLVAALVSLAPATTVLLARFVLRERWNALQGLGLLLALAAGVLISLG
jgi:uncharacterized membrane protein